MNFSVLMTTYDKENPDSLEASLRSITDDQTIFPTQIVLVIDGPVGFSLEKVITKYKKKYTNKFDVIRLPENVGRSMASAQGIKHCKYDYIARMDSDDISVSTRFETQLSVFEKNPNLSVVSGYIAEFESDPNQIKAIRVVPEKHEDICKMFKFRNPINNPAVMFKKEALKKAGGYSKGRACEDFSIYVRMLVTGSIFYNIPQTLVNFRIGTVVLKRRGNINIFFSWCKSQKILLDNKKTNIPMFLISCTACLFFILFPIKIKQFLYCIFLRKSKNV